VNVLRIEFDDERFDAAVHDGLPEGGDLEAIVKDGATIDGAPAVCFTFTVELPDGTLARAQSVTTARLVCALGAAIKGHLDRIGLSGDDSLSDQNEPPSRN
jgi:hypothetical protein